MTSVDLTFGMIYVGVLFNTYLYGITTFQYAAYLRRAANERAVANFIVACLFVLDSAFTSIAVYMSWVYGIVNYTEVDALSTGYWPYFFLPILTATTALIVQAFMGYRIHLLLKNSSISGALVISSLVLYVLALYAGFRAWVLEDVYEVSPAFAFRTAWLAVQAGFVLVLSSLLMYGVTRSSESGPAKSMFCLRTIVDGITQSGVLTTLFAFAGLGTFATYPDTALYAVFIFPIGRVYTHSLLSTLNQPVKSSEPKLGTSLLEISGNPCARANRGTNNAVSLEDRVVVSVDVVTNPPNMSSMGFRLAQSRNMSEHDTEKSFAMA